MSMHANIYQDIRKAAEEHLIAILIVALFILQALSLSLFLNRDAAVDFSGFGAPEEGLVYTEKAAPERSEVPKLSSLRGAQIDAEAAMAIVTADGETVPVQTCETLPVRLWVFLLLAYLALLAFNLASGFERRSSPQWFWELIYTGFALLAWPVWDGCLSTLWYPLAILQMGILAYILYLYFFQRRMRSIDYDHTDEPVW